MNEFLIQWFTLVGIFAVVVISPGPDFIMCLKNALAHGRRVGIMTALGFGLGVGVHVTYTLAGLATLIAKSVILFTALKIVGACYLFYIGVQALRSNGWHVPGNINNGTTPDKTMIDAMRDGFLTNVLNPKATLFFLAIFSQILTPTMNLGHQLILGATCMVMVTVWFAAVSVFMTTPRVRALFALWSKTIDRLCGGVFIALGVKLVLTRL